MEANCLVFPAPNAHTIAQIEDQMILIPRGSSDNQHIPYAALTSKDGLFGVEDEFKDYLQAVKHKCTPRTEANISKEHVKTEERHRSKIEIGTMEGNLKTCQEVDSNEYIPCLFLKGNKDKLMLFFHANGQDLSSAYEFLKMVSVETKYPILAMEYRGYSIFKGQTNPKNIENDAARVMEFLIANKFTSNEIILFGRSIGCAVALTVCQKYNVFSSVLLSPFISLKKIARDLYCGCAGAMVKEVFDNQQNCKKVQSPLLIIHGAKDTLVPYEHSLKLLSGCQAYCRLKIIQNMTHTKFNFRMDFIRHVARFLTDIQN